MFSSTMFDFAMFRRRFFNVGSVFMKFAVGGGEEAASLQNVCFFKVGPNSRESSSVSCQMPVSSKLDLSWVESSSVSAK